MKKAVILFGAGAPVAWGSPLGSKIEQALFDDTEYLVKDESKSLAKYIKEQITEFTNCPPEYVNFEHILNSLEFLIDYEYESSFSINPKFIGTKAIWLKLNEAKWDKIKNFTCTSFDDSTVYFKNNASHKSDTPLQRPKHSVTLLYLVDALKHYISIINKYISRYDQNGHIDQKQYELLNNKFIEFYLNLKEQGYTVRFYTTNYDEFFPRLLRNIAQFYNGFDATNSFPNLSRICKDFDTDCYYNLHGSIYWQNESDMTNFEYSFKYIKDLPSIYTGSRSDRTNPAESTSIFNIVTGFNKLQKTSIEPIKSMLFSFTNDCANADLIGTIGYSYTDIHVNRTLKYSKILNSAKLFHVTYTDNFMGESEFVEMQKITLNNKEVASLKFQDALFRTPDGQNFIFTKGFEEFLLNSRWKEFL